MEIKFGNNTSLARLNYYRFIIAHKLEENYQVLGIGLGVSMDMQLDIKYRPLHWKKPRQKPWQKP